MKIKAGKILQKLHKYLNMHKDSSQHFSTLLFINIPRDLCKNQILTQWGGTRDFASLTSFQVISMLLVHGPHIHPLDSKALHYYMLQFCVLMIITFPEQLTFTRHYLKCTADCISLKLYNNHRGEYTDLYVTSEET